jgi:multicomponent Na+:H+ antiporter subunit D
MTLHPACVLFAAALLVAVTRGVLRQLLLLSGVGLTVWVVLQLTPGAHWTVSFPPATLVLFQVDALSQVFTLTFSMVTALGVLYALHVRHGSELAAALVYAGATLGVVGAGDWLTFFAFWELMAVASLFVIWHGHTPRARAAGARYLLVHVFGGALLLAGILIHCSTTPTLTLQALTDSATANPLAFWLILLGISVNAAIPPLHAWLPDAYPEASVTGSVFLSAFTTKTAVYALLRLFPGAEVLVWAGTLMALYGVAYAIIEDDARRLLSYHIVSQVGYMVAGVGLGSDLALNGASAHAACHLLYKAVLFMGVGAVTQATGLRSLHAGGGLARRLPLVFGLYMLAAFSISGVPLFNGFVSKSLVLSAAVELHRPYQELLLTLASAGTFLSVGLKLPYLLFLGPDRGIRPQAVPSNMLLAMVAGNFLCVWLGVFPAWLYRYLPFPTLAEPYTVDHVLSVMQLLIGTGLGFWWGRHKFGEEATVNLDTDWFYRKPLAQYFPLLIAGARQVGQYLETRGLAWLRRLAPYFHNPFLVLSRVLGVAWPGQGKFSPTAVAATDLTYNEDRYRLPIGSTILWILIFFTLLTLYTWS